MLGKASFGNRFRALRQLGQDALGKLTGGVEPTLIAILSDINMPEMDGLELLGEIKRRYSAGLMHTKMNPISRLLVIPAKARIQAEADSTSNAQVRGPPPWGAGEGLNDDRRP